MSSGGGGALRIPAARAALAVRTGSAVNRLSRLLDLGSGTVIGGRAALAIDPRLIGRLARGRRVALVSGTNGKTTTTGMLVAALTGGTGTGVGTNRTGANMPAGHAAALVDHRLAATIVLEVDEGYLAELIAETEPRVVVLLNLSRDQLDRISEVRMLADLWRQGLAGNGERATGSPMTVVANADDPMVVWAAMAAPTVRWVGVGQVWHDDAVGCPACGGRIEFDPLGGWQCDSCAFGRPELFASIDRSRTLVFADGTRLPLEIELPGTFNRANAAMVAVAAPEMGAATGAEVVTPGTALERLRMLVDVAGRFSTVERLGRTVRLLLAKNPAGWTAIFDLLDEEGGHPAGIVLAVNARVADGLDTSWLWDVPFERLAGRSVIATGERCRDLAVRLRYADVDHTVVPDPLAAVDAAIAAAADVAADVGVASDSASDSAVARSPAPDGAADRPGTAGPVEFLGNYTAFSRLRDRL